MKNVLTVLIIFLLTASTTSGQMVTMVMVKGDSIETKLLGFDGAHYQYRVADKPFSQMQSIAATELDEIIYPDETIIIPNPEKAAFAIRHNPRGFRILELWKRKRVHRFREGQRLRYKLKGDDEIKKEVLYEIKDSSLVFQFNKYKDKKEVRLDQISFIKERPSNYRYKRAFGWILIGALITFFMNMNAVRDLESTPNWKKTIILIAATLIIGFYFLISFTRKKHNMEKWTPKIQVVIKKEKAPRV